MHVGCKIALRLSLKLGFTTYARLPTAGCHTFPRMKKNFLFLLLLCLGGGIWWLSQASSLPPWALSLRSKVLNSDNHGKPPGTAAVGAGRGSEGAPPVPVLLAVVESRDVPIHLNGLGNVQGMNTVTIRSRVDGHLERVAFGEGQDVKAGDVIAQIDARPLQAVLDQTLARKKQNESLLANAKRDLERDLSLLAEKVSTAQKVDTQRALVEQIEATLKADDAAIDAAKIQLGYATIRSPIDGRAGIRMIDEGNVVRAQDPGGIVVVTQLRPLSVVFTLSEQHAHAIRAAAQKGTLGVVALGRDNVSRLSEGVLSVIDNQIDPTTGTLRLKATFANENLELWPGQFVNVRLRLEVRKGATVVPAQVVQRGPAGPFAFVVAAENAVQMRPLQVGRVEDGLALIDSGLEPGERVVLDGHYRLQPGSKVRAVDGGDKGADEARKRMAEGGNLKARP
jgi:multidrug efflux system membrane fusion protein